MPTYLRPGVFVEEKPGGPAPLQGVSASTLAILGWTDKGPDNEATLVTSFTQFVERFGTFTTTSKVPTALFAFFENGGSSAYVVRTTPSDATKSSLYIKNSGVTGESIGAGNGSTAQFTGTLAGAPVPSSLTITASKDATPITNEIFDSSPGDGSSTSYPTTLDNLPVKPGSVTINWTSGSAAKTMTDNGSGAFSSGGGATGTINYTTGAITTNMTGEVPDNATAIKADYTPLTTMTVTDNGSGALTGDVNASGTNTINYDTGAFDVTFSANVTSGTGANTVAAAYDEALWKMTLKWPGTSGNDYRVRIEGNPNYEVKGQGTFTRWDVMIDEYDSDEAVFSEVERFEALDFSTTTSAVFFPTVFNADGDGSDLFTVTTPAFEADTPSSLDGVSVTGETVGAGDGTKTNFTHTTASADAVPYSVTITATKASDSSTMTVTDDGSGNLIGDVNSSGTNTISYTTGAIDVTFSAAVKNSTNVTMNYYDAAATTSYVSQASGGTNGSAVASSDIVGATLAASKKGIYALNAVSSILMVIVPDFAGDETTDGAICDFVDSKDDRFAILTTPSGQDPAEVKSYKQNDLNKNSTKAAIYYPWIKIIDPLTDLVTTFPPVGHIAGIFARVTQQKNVAKAPAGRSDGALRFQVGLEYALSDAEMEVIYPVGVNPMLSRPEVGTCVFGARTLDPTHEYRYIQARRTYQYIAKAVFQGTHWVVFENNGSALWSRVRFQLNAFMSGLYRAGYFAGNSPTESYFVIVDETNNPPEQVAAGKLVVDIGFAPTTPAEFVIFRIQQKTLTS